MPTNQLTHSSRITVGTRFLVLGFLGTILLALPTIGIPLLELVRNEHATLQIADDGQDATYYLGDVGEQLARLRSHAHLPDTRDQVVSIEQRLQTALDTLPGALESRARARWAELAPEVLRLRQVYEEAAARTLAGDEAAATELVANESLAARRVHDELADLAALHREGLMVRLRAAHREASQIGLLEIVLSIGFLTGLTTIWALIARVLRRQERRIVEYTERIEAANADLDAFAARVAHDLKNALGSVVLAPSLIRQAPGDTDAVLRVADLTERSSMRAVAMIDSLLAFSRATSRVEADESSALGPVVAGVLEELAPQIANNHVDLTVDELPDVRVQCSAGLLHVVLVNLCGNAVKYLEGQRERRVRIAAHVERSECGIMIEDTGPGIPTQSLDKIFEPFYRVPGTRAAGTGIGLATVRRVVAARGGRVEVESDVGRGSRFQVWLPLASARAEQSEEPHAGIGEQTAQPPA